jgi:hypothetical protein
VKIGANQAIVAAVNNNFDYICSETLATSLEVVPELLEKEAIEVELDEVNKTYIYISKTN